jgi:hypothetical protein
MQLGGGKARTPAPVSGEKRTEPPSVTLSDDDDDEPLLTADGGGPSGGAQPQPLQLQPAATSSKLPGRLSEEKNKWWCTCKDPAVIKTSGRTWHAALCLRGRWARDSDLAENPSS